MTTKRLSLEEFKAKKVELHGDNLDYLTGGTACGDCLPCENYCHDAVHEKVGGNALDTIEALPNRRDLAGGGNDRVVVGPIETVESAL